MAITSKGNITRNKIIASAKQVFYDKGYKDTLLKDITLHADVTIGDLIYYFKKKDEIVTEIYSQFFKQIIDHIEENCAEATTLQKYCLINHIVYHITFSDEKNKRFHHQLITNKSN
jgi:AcrR family transcriptional regulator